MRALNLTGQTFTRLTAVTPAGRAKNGAFVWACECTCGNKTVVVASDLRNGHAKSCGCLRREILSTSHTGVPSPTRLPHGEAHFNALYREYIQGAKKRGLAFELSKSQVRALFASPCFYCGTPPISKASKRVRYGTFAYNGIDRVDNMKGYIMENVVSCCWKHNQIKGALSVAEILTDFDLIRAGVARFTRPPTGNGSDIL